jgi:predicted enzyme related to lactoylglutathione lyase
MLPNDAEAAWQLAPTASLYLVADPDHAGHGVVTLIVSDLGSYLTEISSRGIMTGAIEQIPGAGRRSRLTDPDGNTVSITELLTAQPGRDSGQ